MAYKVLGQTTSTAPSTATVVTNLVKDPSFTDAAGFARVNPSTATSTIPLSSTSNFAYTPANTTSLYFSNSLYYSVNAKYGATGTAFGSFHGGGGSYDVYIGYGYKAAANNLVNTSSNAAFDATKAIPVTPGVTYYLSYDVYQYNSGSSTAGYNIAYWDATGTYLTQSGAGSSLSNNVWTRNSHNLTAPSGAAYATFWWYQGYSTSNRGYFYDGVSFSSDTSLTSTFTEPAYADTVAMTSPFNKKTDGFIGNTPYTTSALTYAGAQNTLYTTPAGSSAVASTLTVSNLSQIATTYRYAVVPSGQTIAKKHWIAFDIPIAANTTTAYTIGQTLAAGDKIVVVADTSDVAFTLFGNES